MRTPPPIRSPFPTLSYLTSVLLAPGLESAQASSPHLEAESLPGTSLVQLVVNTGSQPGYLLSSSNLTYWTPWAAFPSAQSDLVHFAPAAASTQSDRATYFRVASAILPIPTNYLYAPPGQFLMGSPSTEFDRGPDENQHPATVHRGFWISRTEVTIGQWLEIMPRFPGSLYEGRNPESAANFVSWQDAIEFCRLLTYRDTAASRIPLGSSYRLPTETEWEYAARAGTTTRYPFGDDLNYEQIPRYAWYATNSGGLIHPVGQLPPNPWGLHDIHGNVFEWCLDPDSPYPGSTRLLYHRKIYRGGSFYCPPRVLRPADRSHNGDPYTRDSLVGLRPVLGYLPDSLHTVEIMSAPVSTLHWRPDHTEASLDLNTQSESGTVQYRLLFPVRNELFSNYTAPLTFADAVTIESRVVKPAAVVSDPLIVTLERAAAPQIVAVDTHCVTLTTSDPSSRIEYREIPLGLWTPYPDAQPLPRTVTWAARCWHPEKLTSRQIRLDYPIPDKSPTRSPNS